MKSLNNVQLIACVGQDPKIYAMPSGTLVARFSIATDEIVKDKETKITKKLTEWHAIVMLGHLAEIAERFVQKGAAVYVSGKLRSREFQDKEKITRKITEIIANELIMLDGGKRNEEAFSKIDIEQLTDNEKNENFL